MRGLSESTHFKVISIPSAVGYCREQKANDHTIGLITGCFDILHYGHIRLFRFAKRRVHRLLIGCDNDESIRASKGLERPLFSIDIRLEQLSEMESVDRVFAINGFIRFGDQASHAAWGKIAETIRPSAIVTCERSDSFAEHKRAMARSLGIEYIPFQDDESVSTTSIVSSLMQRVE
ncbi:MAG: adenylyltransferase/cytidyltransferase family protein [Deltaproteobacteria bacterium]|nr:adenylyltransferase/cytidyltransferase family protein [Deltaproteobacteria bacterium]